MNEVLINKQMSVNGLSVQTAFYQDNIEHIFIPLLKKLTAMQKEKGRRIIAFLVAAPGTGKSTFVSFLEQLSLSIPELTPVQAIGIDGFHHTNRYLETHHIDDDPQKPLLRTIKGAPASYDVRKLSDFLARLRTQNLIWPVYSRISHDVSDDGILIDRNIILLEGNYLLLDFPSWDDLENFSDFSIFLKSDPELLKKHLIERKQAGGSTVQEAELHYANTDAPNILLVNTRSKPADLTMTIDADMKYHIFSSL